MAKIKVENWKGRRVFVARENGTIQSWRYVKGSKINKQKAQDIFRENKTFYKNIKKEKQNLTNFTEVTVTRPTTISDRKKAPKRKPKSKIVQYVVSGYYKGEYIAGRSQKLGSTFAQNPRQAKEEAWNNFLKRIANSAGKSYDEDEGIEELQNVKNLREGWVYYAEKSTKTN